MSDHERDTDTPSCGGRGYHSGPVCCGNTVNGECRSHCCVEERVPCGGCDDCATRPAQGEG